MKISDLGNGTTILQIISRELSLKRLRVMSTSSLNGMPRYDCKVWKRIEYPTLINNSNAQRIILVDYQENTKQKPIWSRSSSATKLGELDFDWIVTVTTRPPKHFASQGV
ncbi:hypothetical protein F5X99DRAFT_369283 [Biscogniauxia marginata]|nr:hypothetical protein F5X99DRAFT_369283 [Biscogniauxia marginata]